MRIDKKVNEITEYFEDKIDDSSENSIEIKRRGRPPKKIDLQSDDLWHYIVGVLTSKVRKICMSHGEDIWADTLRVWLIRLAKKIPLMLLHKLFPKS